MKALTLVIGLSLLCFSSFTQAFDASDCEAIYTGGRTIKTVFGTTTGKQAQAQFVNLKLGSKIQSQLTTDEIGIARYEKIESLIGERNFSTSKPDCNDHYKAKLTLVCTKTPLAKVTIADPTSACAYICEQSSYSEDCR